ncbi:MAG TPA: fumarate reductase subunit FrdD [Chloroflexota bacterium]|nr:fumarate reductase subunit FrdD [Chloroflexota bacterium]
MATTTTTATAERTSSPPAAAARPRVDMSHAIWWGLFAVGGMTAAVLLPVHILIQGILGPLGLVPAVSNSYQTYAAAVAHPLVKLYLFVLISLPLFHAAHRLRYFLYDLGLRAGRRLVALLLYGAAILGTIATAYVLLTVP